MSRFRFWHEAILIVYLIGLALFAACADPGFLGREAQITMAGSIWELALLALPMTLIVITAGIDLSVGSAMALCAVVFGILHKEHGISPWFASLAALATGIAAGSLNGLIITWAKVHPLIVTLATLAAFRGMAEGISLCEPYSGYSEQFRSLGHAIYPCCIFVALAVFAAIVLARTRFGLSLYAIGHNEPASRYAGISANRIKVLLYTASGAMAGLAAIIYAARRNTAKADVGAGLELDVITAVVLGGASIFGGSGRIAGTVLGVLAIHETREFVGWHWQRDELNSIVVGALLIVAVAMNSLLSKQER